MVNYCFCAPLLPGGHEAMTKWIKEGIKGNKGHDAVFKQAGITREQVWVQKTPMGDFAVVSLEMQDPAKGFQAVGTSKDPWAVQFRAFIQKAHGIDFSKPVPVNELVSDWKA